MKILHVVNSLDDVPTGQHLLDICRNADAVDAKMAVYALQGGALEHDFIETGVEILKPETRARYDMRIAFDLRNALRSMEFDIVHAHQLTSAIYSYLAARNIADVKKVLSLDYDSVQKINGILLRLIAGRMDKCTVSSKHLLYRLGRKFGVDQNAFAVVYRGIDSVPLQNRFTPVRKRVGISEAAFVITMVGDFTAGNGKDHFTVIDAFRRVVGEMPDTHLLVCGNVHTSGSEKYGDCKRYIKQAGLEQYVHIVDNEFRHGDIFAATDLMVFSEMNDTNPFEVSQALVVGLPMVLSNVHPLKEIAEEDKLALSFKVGNSADLAEQILLLSKNIELREKIAASAFAFAKKNLTMGAYFREISRIYLGLMGISDLELTEVHNRKTPIECYKEASVPDIFRI